jgi:hypothetical protein
MKISERIRIAVALIISVMVLAAPAWAIINRITGSNIWPGDGLYIASGEKDTLHVLPDWFLYIHVDSVGLDTTNFWSYMAQDGGHIDSTMVVNAGVGNEDLHDDAVGNAECAPIDSLWISTGGIGTGSIKNGGVFGEDIAGGQVVKYGRKSGASDTPIYDSVLFAQGSDITITQSGNTLTFAYSGAGGNYYQAWGGANLSVDWTATDSLDVYFPVSEKTDGSYTHAWFVRIINNSSENDETIKVNFSGRLPFGLTQDCDTVTVGYRTSSTDTTVTKVNLQIFAEYVTSGFPPADTSKYVGNSFASGTANTWDWESIDGGDISAIAAGSWIRYEALCLADAGDTIDVEVPYFHGEGK